MMFVMTRERRTILLFGVLAGILLLLVITMLAIRARRRRKKEKGPLIEACCGAGGLRRG